MCVCGCVSVCVVCVWVGGGVVCLVCVCVCVGVVCVCVAFSKVFSCNVDLGCMLCACVCVYELSFEVSKCSIAMSSRICVYATMDVYMDVCIHVCMVA